MDTDFLRSAVLNHSCDDSAVFWIMNVKFKQTLVLHTKIIQQSPIVIRP